MFLTASVSLKNAYLNNIFFPWNYSKWLQLHLVCNNFAQMKDAPNLSYKNMDLPVLYCCYLWKMALPYCIPFHYPYLVADQLPIMWLLDLILWNYNLLSHQGMFSEGILKNAVSNTCTQLKLSGGMEWASLLQSTWYQHLSFINLLSPFSLLCEVTQCHKATMKSMETCCLPMLWGVSPTQMFDSFLLGWDGQGAHPSGFPQVHKARCEKLK